MSTIDSLTDRIIESHNIYYVNFPYFSSTFTYILFGKQIIFKAPPHGNFAGCPTFYRSSLTPRVFQFSQIGFFYNHLTIHSWHDYSLFLFLSWHDFEHLYFIGDNEFIECFNNADECFGVFFILECDDGAFRD